MARIGSFGDIVFEISNKKLLTFKDYSRRGTSRWNQHQIIGDKPKQEFEGPELEEITLTILLKAELGVNPSKQLERIRKMRDSGKAAPLFLGSRSTSPNYWVITNLEENNQIIDKAGNILKAEATLTLTEYYIPKKTEQKATLTTVSTDTTNTESIKKPLGKITITASALRIRSGPSTSHKILGLAYKGETLTVYSVENGWYSLGQGKYVSAEPAYSTLRKDG